MANAQSFDLVVIGAGPGGYVAAIRSSQLELKTAIIERDRLGGICLNWGCIPSKALLSHARLFDEIKHAQRWGLETGELKFKMKEIIQRSRDVAGRLSRGIAHLMKKNEIEVIQGQARFSAPGQLLISNNEGKEEETISAPHVIIASGARARTLSGASPDGRRLITYKEALTLEEVPESMIVIGGGPIGMEFAYFYHTFGCRVTVVEMKDRLLPGEDPEVSQELRKAFEKKGIEILLKTRSTGVEVVDEGAAVSLEGEGGEEEERRAAVVLNAAGVMGNVETLNLDAIRVEVDNSHIKVDRWYRTGAKGVYAIGDVIGPPWLAHVASREGIVCVEHLAGRDPLPLDYHTVPNCTYCQPQVASVGLTEEKALERGYSIKVGKFPFQALGKARAAQSPEGFIKLIFDEKYGELLGAHVIGEEATELIAELVVAKSLEATYLDLLETPHAHPTYSEAIMEAAGMAFGRQIHL